MRIAFNASIIGPLSSGLGVYAANLVKELVKLHDDFALYTAFPEICGTDMTKVRKIRWGVQPSLGFRGHVQRILWVQAILPIRLVVDKASLLLSPVPEGMLAPVVPQVVTLLDIIPVLFPKEYPQAQYYARYFLPAVLRRSEGVITISENTKRDIIAHYGIKPERVHVILPGCDRSGYRLGIDPEGVKRKYGLADYFLYVGNLFPHKNLKRLLRAFALIAGRLPHHLVIGGWKDPRYFEALEDEVKALRLAERVSFLNYIPPDELPALYSGATVFVLPSLYEGFGLPLLEAMACGCPVVVSNAASQPEVCGDAAYYVDPHDIESIAEGISKVALDEELRKKLIHKGLQRAELFSWEKAAAEHIKLLQKV